MSTMDFIMTIDSDDEKRSSKHDGKPRREDEFRIDPDFYFDPSEDPYVDLLQSDKMQDIVKTIVKPVSYLWKSLCFKFALLNHP